MDIKNDFLQYTDLKELRLHDSGEVSARFNEKFMRGEMFTSLDVFKVWAKENLI